MAYDKKFFKMYMDYLAEETVEGKRAEVFTWLDPVINSGLLTLDLGCGTCEVYRNFFGYRNSAFYVGIDKNPIPKKSRSKFNMEDVNIIKGDYLDFNFLKSVVTSYKEEVGIICSLFSVELILNPFEKYKFYERLFTEFKEVDYLIVSGFYYESRATVPLVSETGDIMSYQTNEPLEFHKSELFDENRLVLRVPSKMFGDDVVEVWKIMSRK